MANAASLSVWKSGLCESSAKQEWPDRVKTVTAGRLRKSYNSSKCFDAMKLIFQITAGVVLAWIVITAVKSVLAFTALAHFAGVIDRPPAPMVSAPQPATTSRRDTPYEPPPIAGPQSREQLDASIRADEARAKADHDAQYGRTSEKPAPLIRKATPDDATAKPAN
jgi:hypothetical protein